MQIHSDGPCCIPLQASPQERKPTNAKRISSHLPITSSAEQGGMIPLPGGEFLMGSDNNRFPQDGEAPIRKVTVNAFSISANPVTNAQFHKFVSATGYVTDSERFGWSFVFHQFVHPLNRPSVTQTVRNAPWWMQVAGASWHKPNGGDSSFETYLEHPATHISWRDAQAYCQWADGRLPTEAEWEFAARGGVRQAQYPWGDDLLPNGKHMCNIWQGAFPNINTLEDGFHGAAPVASFPPNGYGLYDTAGNVWEWCADRFSATFHRQDAKITRDNPKGPTTGKTRVMKGGSYLCHNSYCNRYRVAARTAAPDDSASGNVGFRIVTD